jgi:hypothetical protein
MHKEVESSWGSKLAIGIGFWAVAVERAGDVETRAALDKQTRGDL